MKALSVRRFCLYWLPPLVFTVGILIFSGDLGSAAHTQKVLDWLFAWLSLPGIERLEEAQGYLRKAGHILAYGGLYYVWFRAWLWRLSPRRGAAIFCALGFCLLIALADEGHQAMVASRTGCLSDVALDFGAAALAALAFSFKRI
ncbi:MAG: VanZ family protein [Desulfobaccales bacterium]